MQSKYFIPYIKYWREVTQHAYQSSGVKASSNNILISIYWEGHYEPIVERDALLQTFALCSGQTQTLNQYAPSAIRRILYYKSNHTHIKNND